MASFIKEFFESIKSALGLERGLFGVGDEPSRLKRIERMVDTACWDVGLRLDATMRTNLIELLFDDEPAEDVPNKRRLRKTLRAISLGKTPQPSRISPL